MEFFSKLFDRYFLIAIFLLQSFSSNCLGISSISFHPASNRTADSQHVIDKALVDNSVLKVQRSGCLF